MNPSPKPRLSFDEIVLKIAATCRWELKQEGGRTVLDVSTGSGRKQVVAITRDRDIANQEIVRYHSVVGPAGRVDLEVCLRENARLAHGAFAILEDKLILVDTQLIATADPAEIATAIGNLAAYADRFERALFAKDDY